MGVSGYGKFVHAAGAIASQGPSWEQGAYFLPIPSARCPAGSSWGPGSGTPAEEGNGIGWMRSSSVQGWWAPRAPGFLAGRDSDTLVLERHRIPGSRRPAHATAKSSTPEFSAPDQPQRATLRRRRSDDVRLLPGARVPITGLAGS